MDLGVVIRLVVALAAAYLLCGIPFALIIGTRFYGVDLRECGSGNLGATNVYRTLGIGAALATAVLDVSKGAVAVLLATLIVPTAGLGPNAEVWVKILATLAAIMGHSYSPYIHFKGGKGVATAAGCLLILTPYPMPLMVATFILVIVLSRMVSLGSILCAVEYPMLCMIYYPGEWAIIGFSIVAAGLVIWRHRANIVRIAHGEEPKIRLRRGDSDTPQKGTS